MASYKSKYKILQEKGEWEMPRERLEKHIEYPEDSWDRE